LTSISEKAGRWLLYSGIQDTSGGVARYYRADTKENAAVSTEITGYAASALIYLHGLTGHSAYSEAAGRSAQFLACSSWDHQSSTIPFEPSSSKAYFFDLGIIVRGMLAVWRLAGQPELLSGAQRAALSMAFDFLGDGEFHPVIRLPEKEPLDREPGRWSLNPGCYQLKAALAWYEVAAECGEASAHRLYESTLAAGLESHGGFLEGIPDRAAVMDRLHAYCYFLEALLPVSGRAECREALNDGIGQVAALLREIGPEFERSDVCAQLLRVRLIAHHADAVPLDFHAACEEAQRTASYQAHSEDPRLSGGFWFGRKNGEMLPFMNPVSTAFGMQALTLWQMHLAGEWRFELSHLI